MRTSSGHLPEVYSALGQGEGKDKIALLGAEFSVAASGDNQILLAMEAEGHGGGLAPGRKFEFPEFFAGLGVKGAQIIVHCGGGEDQAACGDHGAAESDGSSIHARNEAP